MTPHALSDYLASRYNLLRMLEGEPTQTATGPNFGHVYAYADPHVPNSIPTIGIGINLQTHFNLVLQQLGFDVSGAVLGLTSAVAVAEQSYISRRGKVQGKGVRLGILHKDVD